MDIEKLIEQLQSAAGGPEGIKMCQDAATALSTLQAENEKLKAEVEHWKDAHHQAALNFQQENRGCNKALAELEQMKEIMREDGIMVIPSKYPGGPAEWNIPKPNVQKED